MNDTEMFRVEEADVPRLRAAMSRLERLGYNESRVRERLGLADLSDLRWRALPIYRAERLAVRDALSSAIDLFLLQGVVPLAELGQLFDETDQKALVSTGVLSIDDQGYARATASLFPVGERLIFSDHAWPKLPHPGCAEVPHEQVMYIGADSRWLARATVRRPIEKALDLCTGSGIHALLAASHAQQVTAVDINPRAAHCARFNARAFAHANVEVVVGDLYEPVAQQRFSLITANPPFVPSPVDTLGFRDGGRSGEDVQRRIVEGLPKHLAPGGIAQIVTELGERDDEQTVDRVRSWLGGAPMDILMLRLKEHSAADYAIGHAQGDRDFGDFLNSVTDWAENLKQQRYERVVSVLLAFQWSDPASGLSWTLVEEAQPPSKNASHEIEEMFRVESLACRPDFREMLERSRVRLAGPIGLMESRVLGGNMHAKAQARLLGRSLDTLQWLDLVEHELLVRIEETSNVAELFSSLALDQGLDRETIFAALRSLFQRRLIQVIEVGNA